MPIQIYDSYYGSPFSTSGAFTSPINVLVPKSGGTFQKALYLRHFDLGPTGESSYSLTVTPIDTVANNENLWFQIAPDSSGAPGTYGSAGAAYSAGDVTVGQVKPIWIKATVPSQSNSGILQDMRLRVVSTSSFQKVTLDLKNGTFTNCSYDYFSNAILFDATKYQYGTFITPFFSTTGMTAWHDLILNYTGAMTTVSYRTSTDGTSATAGAWLFDASNVNLAQGYVQIRLEFTASGQALVSGLGRYTYSGAHFEQLVSTQNGRIPYDDNPATDVGVYTPHSCKWIGYFYAATEGVYNFASYSEDGNALIINGLPVYVNMIEGVNVSSTGSVYLKVGWYPVEYRWFSDTGNSYIHSYVTTPGQVQRQVALSDFTLTTPVVRVFGAAMSFSGSLTQDFDIQIFAGPDVPGISINSTKITSSFTPSFTVTSYNNDHINYQIDTAMTFDSPNLTDWTDSTVSGANTTSAPNFNRPTGNYFLRCRSKLGTDFSNWSTLYQFTILPIPASQRVLYINADVALATPALNRNQYFYLNTDNTLVPVNQATLNRYFYLNVDVTLGAGNVIYPFQDTTPTRSTTP